MIFLPAVVAHSPHCATLRQSTQFRWSRCSLRSRHRQLCGKYTRGGSLRPVKALTLTCTHRADTQRSPLQPWSNRHSPREAQPSSQCMPNWRAHRAHALATQSNVRDCVCPRRDMLSQTARATATARVAARATVRAEVHNALPLLSPISNWSWSAQHERQRACIWRPPRGSTMTTGMACCRTKCLHLVHLRRYRRLPYWTNPHGSCGLWRTRSQRAETARVLGRGGHHVARRRRMMPGQRRGGRRRR
mmetsp:Transcript_30166/g.68131  ORF Transcript_30166/g.68131 Transcript_30166/m.68131 type:complete len:247 (+) Transcript_30166:110-850(+)